MDFVRSYIGTPTVELFFPHILTGLLCTHTAKQSKSVEDHLYFGFFLALKICIVKKPFNYAEIHKSVYCSHALKSRSGLRATLAILSLL